MIWPKRLTLRVDLPIAHRALRSLDHKYLHNKRQGIGSRRSRDTYAGVDVPLETMQKISPLH